MRALLTYAGFALLAVGAGAIALALLLNNLSSTTPETAAMYAALSTAVVVVTGAFQALLALLYGVHIRQERYTRIECERIRTAHRHAMTGE